MKHEMHLEEEFFNKVKEGTKKVEIRLRDVKRRALKVGDTILFEDRKTKEKIDAIITDLKVYDTFEEILNDYNLQVLGLNTNDPAFINNFYTPEEIKKYKLPVISFK